MNIFGSSFHVGPNTTQHILSEGHGEHSLNPGDPGDYIDQPYPIGLDPIWQVGTLTHFCPPLQHLLSERLTSLGIMGSPDVPPLCEETSVSRTANVGTWLRKRNGGQKWVKEI